MAVPVELLGDDPHQFRVAVAQGEHSGTCEEVDEHVAVEITDAAAGRLRDRDGEVPGVSTSAGLPSFLASQQLGRPRSG